MYVAPRPGRDDDPHFALRLGLLCVICFAAIQWIQPVVPALVVTLPIAILAGQRKRFDPMLGLVAPLLFIVIIWAMTLIVSLTQPTPVLMIAIAFWIFFAGFWVIRRTGSPIGMLIIMAAALMSIMGLKNPAMLFYFRDGFTQGALLSIIAVPLLYWLIPPASQMAHSREVELIQDRHGIGSLNRAFVLLLLCFWLYAVMPASDMILAIGAIFVLVFPTRGQAASEAVQRTLATLYGTGAALLILLILSWNAHFAMLLGLVALAGVLFGWKMMEGRHPSMVYQYGLSVCIAMVAIALSSQSPAYASIMRILLTGAGAISAAMLIGVLDSLLLNRKAPEPA
tara:strand:+ start:81991 stop:83010 length:1020 start_codon:yes stop_codon:yes gene_type:complete